MKLKVIAIIVVAIVFVFVYSSTIITHPVFANAAQHPCFNGSTDYDCMCSNHPESLSVVCCWTYKIAGKDEIHCQSCEINTGTGEFENCSDYVRTVAPPSSGKVVNIPPIDTSVAPSTKVCPDNSSAAPNTDGKCPHVTQGDSGIKEKEKGKGLTDTGGAGLAVSDEGAPGKKPVKK
jgi:hypothetical protein